MTELTMLATDATKAVESLPIVTNAIAQLQSDLTNDQHKTVLQQAANVLGVAAQSAQALGAQGLIGHNDASNLASGTEIASDGVGIVAEITALATRLKALIAHIF